MIVMGAYLKLNPILKMENIHRGLEKSLPKRHHHMIAINEEAIDVGMKKVNIVNSLD